MHVRDLEWKDFDGWVDLYYARYDEVLTNRELGIYTLETKPSLGEEAKLFGEVWTSVLTGDRVASVAEDEGRVVGVCTVARKGRHLEDRHIGVLGIEVHSDRRGRGIGGELLHHVLAKCRGRFEVIQLTVLEKNLPAVSLYRRFGFVDSGRIPRGFKRDGRCFDELFMWRPVDLQ